MNLNDVTIDDLAQLPLRELVVLQEKLSVAVEKRRRNERNELYGKIAAIASESGFSTAELADLVAKAPKKVLVAKYKNPNNEAEVWSGKGRKPLWVNKAVSEGKSLDDLLI